MWVIVCFHPPSSIKQPVSNANKSDILKQIEILRDVNMILNHIENWKAHRPVVGVGI